MTKRKGRPRKSGPRYACGKLRPEEPRNAITRIKRDEGDPSAGEHPLDYAYRMNLLGTGSTAMRRYRNGIRFAAAQQQARTGAPRIASGGPVEVEQSVLDAPFLGKSWIHDLGHARIAQLWDANFSVMPGPNRAEEAAKRWKEMNDLLTIEQRNELFNVCVVQSWPLWMTTLVVHMGKRSDTETHEQWEARIPSLVGSHRAMARRALLSGLDALSPKSEPPAKPEPKSRYSGPVATETTRYVDEDGELLYEVERRVRR